MSHEEKDEFVVDLEDITPTPENVRRLPAKLRLWRAVISHIIAAILIISLVLSIILYTLLVCKYPDQQESISTAFEKWYAVIGPFAGLALGAYYGASITRH